MEGPELEDTVFKTCRDRFQNEDATMMLQTWTLSAPATCFHSAFLLDPFGMNFEHSNHEPFESVTAMLLLDLVAVAFGKAGDLCYNRQHPGQTSTVLRLCSMSKLAGSPDASASETAQSKYRLGQLSILSNLVQASVSQVCFPETSSSSSDGFDHCYDFSKCLHVSGALHGSQTLLRWSSYIFLILTSRVGGAFNMLTRCSLWVSFACAGRVNRCKVCNLCLF